MIPSSRTQLSYFIKEQNILCINNSFRWKQKPDLPRYHKYNNAFIQTSQLFNFIKQLFALNSLGGLRVFFKTDISESNTLKGLPNGCFMVSLLCWLLFYSIIIKYKVNWVHIQFCVRLKKKDSPWWRHPVCCLSVQSHFICSHICLGWILDCSDGERLIFG